MTATVRVPSLSNPAVAYTVHRRGDALVCDCPRAGFLGLLRAEEDKHVQLVRLALRWEARCAEAHGLRPEGGVCQQCLVQLLAGMAGKVRQAFVPVAEAKARVAKARHPAPKRYRCRTCADVFAKPSDRRAHERATHGGGLAVDVACPGRHAVGCECLSCQHGHVNCGLTG